MSHDTNPSNPGTQAPDTDFVMNEAERGAGTGTSSLSSFSSSFLPSLPAITTSNVASETWGQGDPTWGEPSASALEPRQHRATRTPLMPQAALFTTDPQPYRITTTPFTREHERSSRSIGSNPASERRTHYQHHSSESTKLVEKSRSLGINVPYRYDSDIPWDARGIIEDLIFHLNQKTNEVSHLQRKLDNTNRESRVRKREGSLEDCRPSKRRERSREDSSSYGPSPIVPPRSFETQSTGATTNEPTYTQARPVVPPRAPARYAGPSNPHHGQDNAGPSRPTVPHQGTTNTPPTRIPAPPRLTQRPDPVLINGRPYEPAIKFIPPGPLRPSPRLLQQEVRHRSPPPPPSYSESEDPYRFDESDEDSDDDVVKPPQDDRSLREDIAVPQFWGVVRVTDFFGVPGQEGLEHDNAMRNMLSRTTYLSRTTNTVYVGDSAQEAKIHERRDIGAYTPHNSSNSNNNQVYVRAPRGLPLNPYQVKQLRTLYRDNGDRFPIRQRVEAYLLLKELYTIACRVLPEHRDRAMEFLLEPKGFDTTPPVFFPVGALGCVRPPPRNNPPRQPQPPASSDLANVDDVGLYLLNYHRPGSSNSLSGVAFDYAFRIGRRTLFGHILARVMVPLERDLHQVFRRQFILAVVLPRRYQETIVEYNRANPQKPFVPQGGPVYTIYRPRLESAVAANFSIQDIFNVLLDNRIPPEWVDHTYSSGILALNHLYSGAPLTRSLLDPTDNERLARLHIYGEPPAIAEWDGWRHPTRDEVQTLHDIMDLEDYRLSQRVPSDAPTQVRVNETPNWLLVGQTGVVEYLTSRPQAMASQYTITNPVTLPYYVELDTPTSPAIPPPLDATMAPPSGNPPVDTATTDVSMAVNTDIAPSSGVHPGSDVAVTSPVQETPEANMTSQIPSTKI